MNYLAKQYNKEAFQQYAAAIIGGYQDIIEVLKAIIEVGAKMDGKVLNKRFITAIEEKINVAIVSMSDQYNLGYRDLHIYLNNRSININGSWEYFDKQICCNYIHNIEKSFCEYESENLKVNPRIVCSKVEATCNEYIETCCKYIRKWQDASDNYDKYTEQLKNAVRQFGEAMKGLNDYFCPSEIYKYDWEHTD
jgi:hypothetical protein